MTVREMIERLKLCPPDAVVLISLVPDGDGGGSGFGRAYDVVSPFPDTCEIAARGYTCARPLLLREGRR